MTFFLSSWHVVEWLRRRNAAGDLLVLAYAVLVASFVLSNNYNLAPKIFLLLVIPAAFVLNASAIATPSWPAAGLSVRFESRLVFSAILFSALVYVLSLTVATWRQPDFDRRLVDQMWLHAGEILVFMTVTAHTVAHVTRFLSRLIAVLVPLIAVSAILNIGAFLSAIGPEPVSELRLVNWLGMPGYTNSTNISLTYAVFCASAVAAMMDREARLLLRLWLAPFAAILLVAVLLTQARSAYLGIAVGVCVVVCLTKDAPFRKRHAVGLAAIAVICGIALGMIPQVRDVFTRRGESMRPAIWKLYLDKATAKPLLGYGALSNIDVVVNNEIIGQPHNLVLSAQIRGGVFCMLAMAALLAASAWWAFRFHAQRGCAIPLAMIATIIPTGMFDYNLLVTAATWPWLTFWLPFAICAGGEIAMRDGNASKAAR